MLLLLFVKLIHRKIEKKVAPFACAVEDIARVLLFVDFLHIDIFLEIEIKINPDTTTLRTITCCPHGVHEDPKVIA